MNEQYPSNPIERGPESEPSQEQYQVINDTLLSYIQRENIRGTDFTDDKPADDEPAKKYVIPVTDQAKELFLVPVGLRNDNPRDFTITYITPHRFEESEIPHQEIRFSYRYGDDESADYILHGADTDDWTGTHMLSDSEEFGVTGIHMRDLTRADLNMLGTVTAAVTQLNR